MGKVSVFFLDVTYYDKRDDPLEIEISTGNTCRGKILR